jgi:hypothetical protein
MRRARRQIRNPKLEIRNKHQRANGKPETTPEEKEAKAEIGDKLR